MRIQQRNMGKRHPYFNRTFVVSTNGQVHSKTKGECMHNPIQLNKKTIMNLVEGHIITSNTIRSDGFPMVCEYVSKPEEREEQWKRIRQVSSGKGYIYETEASFLETLKFYLSHKTEYNDR